MMRYSKLWIAALSLATVAFAGCTNEEDLGGRSAALDGGAEDRPAADAGNNATSEAGVARDAGEDDTFGKTNAGESCDPSKFYPPATTTCSIPGAYAVSEDDCTGGTCGPLTDTYRWQAAVTVSGTEVTLTNGTDRRYSCQLTTACDCLTKGGRLIRFTSTGFFELGKADCGSGESHYVAKGTKL